MKTGNTLRMAKNSLLCFFMTLAGGFLVACGSSSDGVMDPGPSLDVKDDSFRTYLLDTAVEGVEYSGPTGDGVTGKGGVFPALVSEEAFVFSIGATTLGSIVVTSDQSNEVTPSDFIGVDDASMAISIARIMQGLDADATLQNGISISQTSRDHQSNLFDILDSRPDELAFDTPVNGPTYNIPSVEGAESHLTATRQCLFSGGYVGDYLVATRNGNPLESAEGGTVYYAVEPFANRARRFGFTGDADTLDLFDSTSTVGVIGSDISLAVGNTLFFTTPRLVTVKWERMEGTTVTVSGTATLAAVGNPGATRRIVGVETTANTLTVTGMYVLDYFANDNEANGGSFSGQYYDVVNAGTVSVSPLILTIAADGGSWASVAMTTTATTLTLIGTRGESDMTITMGIVRTSDYHGSFEGVGNELSGTWCDIGGAVGSATPPTPPTPIPPTPSAPSVSVQNTVMIEITWSPVQMATVYKLYRSTVSGGTYTQVGGDLATLAYTDSRDSAETQYFYQLEACNSAGCSGRSQEEVSTLPAPADMPVVTAVAVSGNESEISLSWISVSDATSYNLYRSTSSDGTYIRVRSDISDLAYTDSGLSAATQYFYQLEACNSGGCSERSTEVSATTVPERPGTLAAAGQSRTEIMVTWVEVPGATSYRIYQSDMSDGTYTRIADSGDISELTYTHTELSAGTQYFYQLEACNSGGCSSRSDEAEGMTNS